MTTETVEVKAGRLVDEGRVSISTRTEDVVVAVVAGDTGSYRVTRSADGSFEGCSCPAVARCSHIEAVSLVTGSGDHDAMDVPDAPQSPGTDFEPPEGQDQGSVAAPTTDGVQRESGIVDVDPETGEVVETAEIAGHEVDAALFPLAETPVTYQTLRAIARTDFVPAALRGRPEAVLACVLYGRELGLGPMESLSSIDVIDGRPSPEAQLLARLIRTAGHTVEVLEASDTACRLRGTRGDNGETMEVGFSIDDARRVTTREKGAVVALAETKRWREYPADMCWARAVSRLHRRLFPDITTLRTEPT